MAVLTVPNTNNRGQSGSRVLVVYASDDTDSTAIALAYQTLRKVPAANMLAVSGVTASNYTNAMVGTDGQIQNVTWTKAVGTYANWFTNVYTPVQNWLNVGNRRKFIRFIAICKGLPHKAPGITSGGANRSTDAMLGIPGGVIGQESLGLAESGWNRTGNRYFPSLDGGFLPVCRLECPTQAQTIAWLTAQAGATAQDGLWYFQAPAAGFTLGSAAILAGMNSAKTMLEGKGMTCGLDGIDTAFQTKTNLMGYYSNGLYTNTYSPSRWKACTFRPGALVFLQQSWPTLFYTSITNAPGSSFVNRQPQLMDAIVQGAVGLGTVEENGGDWFTFEAGAKAYAEGACFGDVVGLASNMARPYVGVLQQLVTIAIGDPLCAPYRYQKFTGSL